MLVAKNNYFTYLLTHLSHSHATNFMDKFVLHILLLRCSGKQINGEIGAPLIILGYLHPIFEQKIYTIKFIYTYT